MDSKEQKSLLPALLVWLACFCLAVMLQRASGAFESEFGGHPDEAAHYVTGLMIRDYVAGGFPGSPLAFAKNYYDHYPKVALGNWPPGFYLIQSAWTLIASPQRVSIMLLMAAMTAGVASLLFLALRREFGSVLGVAGAMLFVALPVVQQHTAMVMTEVPITLLVFASLLALMRFLERESRLSAVAFGVLASAAILTKGSALFLALVPVPAILLVRKVHLLRRPVLWGSAFLVAAICFPWTWMFRDQARAGWLEGDPSWAFTSKAIVYYPKQLVLALGFGLSAFLVLGLLVALWRGSARPLPVRWAVGSSAVAALLLFHAAVPCGFETRHLVPVLPVCLLFVVAGMDEVAGWLKRFGWTRATCILAAVGAAMAIFLVETFTIPRKNWIGFGQVAERLLADSAVGGDVFMVSSDARGEGMFISELAMREVRPGHEVQRSSKLLASSSWSGSGYQAKFESERALAEFLRSNAASWLVVDVSVPPRSRRPHHDLMVKATASHPEWFHLEETFTLQRNGVISNGILLYRVQR